MNADEPRRGSRPFGANVGYGGTRREPTPLVGGGPYGGGEGVKGSVCRAAISSPLWVLPNVLYLDLASVIVDRVEYPPGIRKAPILVMAPAVPSRDLPLDVLAGLRVSAVMLRVGAEFLPDLQLEV